MSDVFTALADPTRRKLLEVLAGHPGMTVSELVEATGDGQPTVSKHLKTLREAGLVELEVSGQRRGYSVSIAGFTPVYGWLAKVAAVGEASNLQARFGELGEKIGAWLSQGSTWVGEQVADRIDLDTDVKKLGHELGRKLAEAKVQAEKVAKETATDAGRKAREVKDEALKATGDAAEQLKTRAKSAAEEVKTRLKGKSD